MAIRVGGKELAMVYASAVHNGRDGTHEVRLFIQCLQRESGEPVDVADPKDWGLGDFVDRIEQGSVIFPG